MAISLRIPKRARLLAAQYVTTIVVGVGAATAVLSVTLALGYAPLPFRSPRRIVTVWERAPSGSVLAISPPDMEDFRAQARAQLASLGGIWAIPLWLGGPGGTRQQVDACSMQAGALRSLNFRPVLGRPPAPDDQPGAIWVSRRVWQGLLGGRASAVGSHVSGTTDPAGPLGQRFLLAGVFPDGASVHLPFMKVCSGAWIIAPALSNLSRRASVLFGVGRLRPGYTAAQAQAALRAAASRLAARFSFEHGRLPIVEGMQAIAQGPARRTTGLLAFGVGLAFLAGCLNLAVLMIAEGDRRRSEVAIRAALGASPWRLMREAAAEKCLLALGSLLLAAIFAAILVPLLARLVEAAGLGAPVARTPPLNGYVLLGFAAFSIAASLAWAALLVRAAGGWRFSPTLITAGGPGSSAGTAAAKPRWRLALLAAQSGVGICLLAAAVSATRGYIARSSAQLGPAPSHTVLMNVAPTRYTVVGHARLMELNREILDRLGQLPRTSAVALADQIPHGEEQEFRLASDPPGTSREATRPVAVSAGYFKIFGIRILRGRIFRDAGLNPGEPEAMINLAMATANWPSAESAVGSEIVLGPKVRYRIVGVVANFTGWWYQRPVPGIYLPATQSETQGGIAILRTNLPTGSLAVFSRQILARGDLQVTISEITTMRARWLAQLTRPLARMVGMVLLALLGLMLCIQGVYAVAEAAVASRKHELAVRAALGARAHRLTWDATGGPVGAVAAGCVAGLAASYYLQPLLAEALGTPVRPQAGPLAVAAALLVLTAAAGCYLPARTAARINPAEALREG